MKTIYITRTEGNTYLKIGLSCEQKSDNIGCLQHVVHPGTINVKQTLKDIIEASTRSPLKFMPFTTNSDSTRSHGGVNYVGYYICDGLPQAIDLLNKAVADSGYILEL
jgi:hypothetical protein